MSGQWGGERDGTNNPIRGSTWLRKLALNMTDVVLWGQTSPSHPFNLLYSHFRRCLTGTDTTGGSSAKAVRNPDAQHHHEVLPCKYTPVYFFQQWFSKHRKDIIQPFPQFNLTLSIQVFGERERERERQSFYHESLLGSAGI